MKLRIVAFLLLIFLSVNVAAAEYPYFIQDSSKLWIPVDLEGSSNQTLYVLKTDGYAPDGHAAFPVFFDDFPGTSLNVTKWSTVPSGYTVSDSVLSITAGNLYSADSWGQGYGLIGYGAIAPSNNNDFGLRSSTPQWARFILSSTTYTASSYVSANSVTSIGSIYNGDHLWDIQRTTSTNTYLIDGTVVATHSSQVSTENTNIRMNHYSGTTSFDWMAIRKCTLNKPTISIIDAGEYYVIEIQNNEATALTDYQIEIDANDLNILSSNESLLISDSPPYPEITVSLSAPTNDSIVSSNTLQYNITGSGNLSATVYIDSNPVWSGPVSDGLNQITPTLSQGTHEWYVNASATVDEDTVYNTSETWSFTYDTIDPSPSASISPDANNIADGTTVQTHIKWSDTNLKNAFFYVNYGSGYTFEDSITFTSSDQWFNTSINTTGLAGDSISWYQIAYDEAGNSHTYSDSFNVVMSELNIYVYDERTGQSILPSNVVVYNDNLSKEAIISDSTNVSSLSYDGLTTDKYIVQVSANGYYSRRAIMLVDITSLSELDVYLPSESEDVIYDNFKIIDNTLGFDNKDIILRLEKPLPNGTDIIYSSYFDFAGTTATYLIATDQYILSVVTPEQTISYGWLTPDPDGEIQITINEYEFEKHNEWLNYTYTETNTSVAFDYGSSKPVSFASLIITTDDGNEVYNVNASTDSGSFIHNFAENGTYTVNVSVGADDGDIFTVQRYMEIGKTDKRDFFPDSYSMLLKSIVVLFAMIIGVIALSSYRADLSAAWVFLTYGFSVYQEWVFGNAITVAIIGLIALAAIKRFHKRESRM